MSAPTTTTVSDVVWVLAVLFIALFCVMAASPYLLRHADKDDEDGDDE